ncbi:MAG: hypothetical protein NTZ59_15800 [Bacteroidetes bacterium]|nr:hypothetical protein [Bacteroidota bacterium]
MKKIILILLLLISSSVLAEWKYITRTDEDKFYYEPSSIKKTKTYTKAWILLDFKEPVTYKGITYLSNKSLWHLNCVDEEQKTVQSLSYSDHMGTGQMVDFRNDKIDWASIVPDTNQEVIFKVICRGIK